MQSPRARHSDVFRPRLPLDPFTAIDRRHPWPLSPDALHALTPAPQVVLILGAPTKHDLLPLLYAPSLARSLVLIATHTPIPRIPNTTHLSPTVRILRLSSPLAVEVSGALRLVNLLERAERVARVWRKHPSDNQPILQLREASPGADFTIVEDVSMDPFPTSPPPPTDNSMYADSLTRYPSPAPSSLSSHSSSSIRPLSAPASSRKPLSSYTSSSSLSALSSKFSSPRSPLSVSTTSLGSSTSKSLKSSKLPPQNASQRPFDAILNFLPPSTPDKSILKSAILVTTLSHPFVAAASPPVPPLPHLFNPQPTQLPRTYPPSHQGFASASEPLSRKRSSMLAKSAKTLPSTAPSSPSASNNRLSTFIFRHKSTKVYSISAPQSRDSFASHASSPISHHHPRIKAHVVHILPANYPYSPLTNSNTSPSLSRSYSSTSTLHAPPTSFRSSVPPPRRNTVSPPKVASLQPTSGGKPKVVQSIEQFLLSFAYPLTSISGAGSGSGSLPGRSLSNPAAPSYALSSRSASTTTNASLAAAARVDHSMDDRGLERPAPFIVAAGVLGSALVNSRGHLDPRVCVGELILGGVLDVEGRGGGEGGWPRAWIGGGEDVKLRGSESSVDEMQSQPLVPAVVHVRPAKERIVTERGGAQKGKGAVGLGGLPTPPESSASVESGGGSGSEDGESSAEEQQRSRDKISRDVVTAVAHRSSGQPIDVGKGANRREMVVKNTEREKVKKGRKRGWRFWRSD